MSLLHPARSTKAGHRHVCGGPVSGLLAVICAGGAAAGAAQAQSHPPSQPALAPYASKLSQPRYKLVVEKDVRIPTRGGSYLMADVFRPDAPGETFPPLLSLSV